MQAINDYIVLTEIVEPKKENEIYIPGESEKARYRKGKVNSVGDGVRSIKKDDIIFFDNAGSHEWRYNSNNYVVIQLRNVVIKV